MSEPVPHSPGPTSLEPHQLQDMVHALLNMLASLRFFREKDDTSIAWEDGEIDEDDAA